MFLAFSLIFLMVTATNNYALHLSLFIISQFTHLPTTLKMTETSHLDYLLMAMESSHVDRQLLGHS